MARLRDVVGAIFDDLVRARAGADRATRDAVAAYAADPVLRTLPVPRVEISNVNISLPFIVDRLEPVAEPAISAKDVDAAIAERLERVGRLGLRGGPRGRTLSDLMGDRVVELRQPLARRLTDRAVALSDLLADDRKAFDEALTQEFSGLLEQGFDAKLSAQGLRDAGKLVAEIGDRLAAAEKAERLDIQVGVTAGDLAEAPADRIGRFTFSVSLSDLDVIGRDDDEDGGPVLVPR
jgi:hypothetical protein